MAKNKEAGDNRRVGAVKERSQVQSPLTGNWTKRDSETGKFMDQKEDGTPFKGVRKEKPAAAKAAAAKAPAAKAAAKAPAKKAAAKKAPAKKG